MRFMRTPMARRCVGKRPLNPRAPVETVRSISDADDNHPALIGPSTARFIDWGCRFHFRLSFDSGRITDVVVLRICADRRHQPSSELGVPGSNVMETERARINPLRP